MNALKRLPLLHFTFILASVALAAIYFLIEGSLGHRELGTAFLAMLGTFLGAAFAFRLTEHKEHLTEIRRQKIALNRALFTVIRQYNAVRWLKKSMAPYKMDYERAFNCPAIKPPDYEDLVYDFDSLAFIFDESDPSLLMKLSVEQEGFHQSIESLKARNEFYVGEVQPFIAKVGFNRKAVPAAEFRSALGERLFEGAMNGAALAYQNIDQSCTCLLDLHDELFRTAKARFPDTKFIKLVPDA